MSKYDKYSLKELEDLITNPSLPPVAKETLEKVIKAKKAETKPPKAKAPAKKKVTPKKSVTKKTDTTVAKTILEQLGGRANLVMMTGAKTFVADNNWVSFRIPKPNGVKVNYVKIELTGRDDYDVTFGYVRGTDYSVTNKIEGIYFDRLPKVFEENTGLYLQLMPKKPVVKKTEPKVTPKKAAEPKKEKTSDTKIADCKKALKEADYTVTKVKTKEGKTKVVRKKRPERAIVITKSESIMKTVKKDIPKAKKEDQEFMKVVDGIASKLQEMLVKLDQLAKSGDEKKLNDIYELLKGI